jgi:hypothetical protein
MHDGRERRYSNISLPAGALKTAGFRHNPPTLTLFNGGGHGDAVLTD